MSLTGLLFALAFCIACVLAFARHPVYGLLAYVGVFYLHPPSRWWGQGILLDVRWAFVAAAVTLLAILVRSPSKGQQKRFLQEGVVWALLAFVCWLGIQQLWAISPEAQLEIAEYYLKFAIAMFMIYRCIETENHLRMFLWTHVLGCFYFGWLAYTSRSGGRFEDFGGPGLSEANAAALQIVTGIIVAASLFLAGKLRDKVIVGGIMPFLVNAVVATISRSGFLAFASAGLIYNLFTPPRYRRLVRVLSVLGLVLFVMLTNQSYWSRIETIKYRGQSVEGVDTGAGRVEILRAQLRMASAHPMGCGHMCTTTLSASYMDESLLFRGGRASHNTFMSALVDHGIPGAVAYVAMVIWGFGAIRKLYGRLRGQQGFLATVLPAVAGASGAIVVGDMFVPYMKYETRFWFIALILVMLRMTDTAPPSQAAAEPRHGKRGGSRG